MNKYPLVYEYRDKIGQVITQKLIPGEHIMKQAIVYITTKENGIWFHTRKGLSKNRDDATRFKTLKHGLKTARKKYRTFLGLTVKTYTVEEQT